MLKIAGNTLVLLSMQRKIIEQCMCAQAATNFPSFSDFQPFYFIKIHLQKIQMLLIELRPVRAKQCIE